MKINNIVIENFLSMEHVSIDFEKFSELVLVEGKNKDTKPISSNGAGKSSVIEALVFALFGKTIRKTTEKSLTNLHTEGKCKVTLTVNNNIVIERTKKPSKLVVMVGDKNETRDNVMATQKYLEKTLNINPQIFLASIVFGQGIKTDFLTATADEKRAIIQNFLNLSDLFEMRSKLRSLKSHALNAKKVASTLNDEAFARSDKLKGKLKKLRAAKKEFSVIFTPEKSKFINKYSISEIQEKERIYHDLDINLESASHQLHKVRTEIKSSLSRIERSQGGACEHCSKVSLEIWNMIKEDEQSVINKNSILLNLKKDIKKLKEKLEENYVPITIRDFELIEESKTIDTKISNFESQVREHNRIKKKHLEEVTVAQKRYDLLKFWEVAFSEQGLVKYVIRNILTFFNDRANYYMNFLTAGNFTIDFNEFLEETVFLKKKKVYYTSLSGGEKKKVSLSVMLALNDLLLLSGKDRSNIIFFDEIADSLDEEGIKGLYELIKEVTNSKTMFIITHNDYLMGLIEDWAEHLVVEKKKGITTVKTKNAVL